MADRACGPQRQGHLAKVLHDLQVAQQPPTDIARALTAQDTFGRRFRFARQAQQRNGSVAAACAFQAYALPHPPEAERKEALTGTEHSFQDSDRELSKLPHAPPGSGLDVGTYCDRQRYSP